MRMLLWVLCLTVAVQAYAADSETSSVNAHYLIEMSCPPSQPAVVTATLRLALALREDGSQVTLFVDVDAVQLASTDAESPMTAQQKEVNRLFEQARSAGVAMLVCPHCAELFGLTSEGLRDGIRFTSKEELESVRRQADKVFEYRGTPVATSLDGIREI